jgi:hypothetical protein
MFALSAAAASARFTRLPLRAATPDRQPAAVRS